MESPAINPITTDGIYECVDGTWVVIVWSGRAHVPNVVSRHATAAEAQRAHYGMSRAEYAEYVRVSAEIETEHARHATPR